MTSRALKDAREAQFDDFRYRGLLHVGGAQEQIWLRQLNLNLQNVGALPGPRPQGYGRPGRASGVLRKTAKVRNAAARRAPA